MHQKVDAVPLVHHSCWVYCEGYRVSDLGRSTAIVQLQQNGIFQIPIIIVPVVITCRRNLPQQHQHALVPAGLLRFHLTQGQHAAFIGRGRCGKASALQEGAG